MRRSVLLITWVAATLLLALRAGGQAGAPASAQATRLAITTPARLVDCAPVTQIPCMSVGLTPADSLGKPAPVALPGAKELASAFTFKSGAEERKPFFASAGSGPDAGQHINVVLMMVDISGSMNEPAPGGLTRIGAVKSALGQYLEGMQEGSDRIAIVPFESHNVVSTIRAAVFATRKADAIAQLKALPPPSPKGNTALYQAVFSGVDAVSAELSQLQREGHAAGELQPHVIIMTDGKNEVATGDDPLLLNGPLGLQQAATQVQTAHFDVIGIGFGNREAIDAVSLQRLSTRFFYATDAAQLLDALHSSRSAQSHEIQVSWMLAEGSRLALAGRDQVWVPSLQLEGLPNLTGDPVRLIFPATAAPLFDRHATQPELAALIATHPPANSGWSNVLVHVLLFLGAGALLLTLWFWVPRLIWGEQYLDAIPQASRWGAERTGVTSASGVQVRSSAPLPAGFSSLDEPAGAIQRSAAQTTQVGPRGEFSRTRLTYDQK